MFNNVIKILFSMLFIFFVFQTQASECHPKPSVGFIPSVDIGSPDPTSLEGAGTRNGTDESYAKESSGQIIFLAPKEKGLSSKENISFFWFSKQPTSGIFKINVIGNKDSGIEISNLTGNNLEDCLSISEILPTKLKKGIVYTWSVHQIINNKQIINSGEVSFQAPKAELKAKLRKTHSDLEKVQIYLEAHYVFDAIEILCKGVIGYQNNQEEQKIMIESLEKNGVELKEFKTLILSSGSNL